MFPVCLCVCLCVCVCAYPNYLIHVWRTVIDFSCTFAQPYVAKELKSEVESTCRANGKDADLWMQLMNTVLANGGSIEVGDFVNSLYLLHRPPLPPPSPLTPHHVHKPLNACPTSLRPLHPRAPTPRLVRKRKRSRRNVQRGSSL